MLDMQTVIDTSGGYAVPASDICSTATFQDVAERNFSGSRPELCFIHGIKSDAWLCCICSCGASFDVAVISSQFEGKKLLDRHRMVLKPSEHHVRKGTIKAPQTREICLYSLPESMLISHELHYYLQINSALEEEMKSIHALSIRQCWTPEQQKAKQGS